MDRGAWRDAVHGVAESRTRPRRLSTHTQALLGSVSSSSKAGAVY